ncbi:hypothetical protein AYI69_g6812 [Smittium culicis]|uniref:Uncharacterized protein n=1 Tax=Smittium culicis TaxID=133412 RepID=A0A1R1XWB7_9FUNG|nr:hypothetical protein AYI69_g6812 [Smittium culicis]
MLDLLKTSSKIASSKPTKSIYRSAPLRNLSAQTNIMDMKMFRKPHPSVSSMISTRTHSNSTFYGDEDFYSQSIQKSFSQPRLNILNRSTYFYGR